MPLRERRRPVLPRLLVNVGISLSALAVAAALLTPTAEALLSFTDSAQVGLLHWFELPVGIELALGLLALDLSFYWWHRANHRVPLLWRFHAAHHVDPDLDVTTATRFHFGEIFFSVGFRAIQITALGIPVLTYITYEVVFQTGAMFHHSNWRLPGRLDRALAFLVVTPQMHGIHHSQVRTEVNSNYSVILNIWDRIHRTLRLDVPQEQIRIGVPGYDQPDDNRLGHVIAEPFRRQRVYWPEQTPTPTRASSNDA